MNDHILVFLGGAMKLFLIGLAALSVGVANAMERTEAEAPMTLQAFRSLSPAEQKVHFKDLSLDDKFLWYADIVEKAKADEGEAVSIQDIMMVMRGYMERKKTGNPDEKDLQAIKITRSVPHGKTTALIERALLEEYKPKS
jgi:hypothetical protein